MLNILQFTVEAYYFLQNKQIITRNEMLASKTTGNTSYKIYLKFVELRLSKPLILRDMFKIHNELRINEEIGASWFAYEL